jgi:polyphosphate kinase
MASTDEVAQREAEQAVALDATELYANRELSWLDFNDRVLQLSEDEKMPLLERVKFLAIYESNLDEFFMVRVAGHHDQVDAGITGRDADGLSASETIDRISERVRELDGRHERQWERVVRPALEEQGIRVVSCADCSEKELAAADRQFHEQIFPALTPLAVGPGRPFPYISNLSLSLGLFVVDPANGERRFARVKVPEVLPRFIALERSRRYIALEDVIADNLGRLFPGMRVEEHATFRVTRDADFDISEATEDLLEAIEQELSRRRFGDVVRLEVEADMSDGMCGTILAALGVHPDHVYRARTPLDLADLFPLASIDRPDLRFRPWTCSPRSAAATSSSITRTTRSRPLSSASSSRPSTIRTCSRSSTRSTARAATPRSCRR